MRGKKAKALRRGIKRAEMMALIQWRLQFPEKDMPSEDALRTYRKRTGKAIKRSLK